jgi:very-short-patch-repair endonuclease
VREIFTTKELFAFGLSPEAIRHGARTGEWSDAGYGCWAKGPAPVTDLERSIAGARATRGGISGTAAGEFYGLDNVTTQRVDFTVPPDTSNLRAGARRRYVKFAHVNGVRLTSGTQTLLDLAACLDDLTWEQALESALRKHLTAIDFVLAQLPVMSASRTPGVKRIRRVLALRPDGAPPTESLLETLAVQMFRAAGLPDPRRQVVVCNEQGVFIARVDLAWPELGVFVELDGQHHAGQPVHDANRQNRVQGATGWLCARLTWTQVTRHPKASVREVEALLARAAALRSMKIGAKAAR